MRQQRLWVEEIVEIATCLAVARARAVLGELVCAAIELEQPFDVVSERDEWIAWAAGVLARADALAFDLRVNMHELDGQVEGDGRYLGGYLAELDELRARVRRAMA